MIIRFVIFSYLVIHMSELFEEEISTEKIKQDFTVESIFYFICFMKALSAHF